MVLPTVGGLICASSMVMHSAPQDAESILSTRGIWVNVDLPSQLALLTMFFS